MQALVEEVGAKRENTDVVFTDILIPITRLEEFPQPIKARSLTEDIVHYEQV
jgi:hypothetical protein